MMDFPMAQDYQDDTNNGRRPGHYSDPEVVPKKRRPLKAGGLLGAGVQPPPRPASAGPAVAKIRRTNSSSSGIRRLEEIKVETSGHSEEGSGGGSFSPASAGTTVSSATTPGSAPGTFLAIDAAGNLVQATAAPQMFTGLQLAQAPQVVALAPGPALAFQPGVQLQAVAAAAPAAATLIPASSGPAAAVAMPTQQQQPAASDPAAAGGQQYVILRTQLQPAGAPSLGPGQVLQYSPGQLLHYSTGQTFQLPSASIAGGTAPQIYLLSQQQAPTMLSAPAQQVQLQFQQQQPNMASAPAVASLSQPVGEQSTLAAPGMMQRSTSGTLIVPPGAAVQRSASGSLLPQSGQMDPAQPAATGTSGNPQAGLLQISNASVFATHGQQQQPQQQPTVYIQVQQQPQQQHQQQQQLQTGGPSQQMAVAGSHSPNTQPQVSFQLPASMSLSRSPAPHMFQNVAQPTAAPVQLVFGPAPTYGQSVGQPASLAHPVTVASAVAVGQQPSAVPLATAANSGAASVQTAGSFTSQVSAVPVAVSALPATQTPSPPDMLQTQLSTSSIVTVTDFLSQQHHALDQLQRKLSMDLGSLPPSLAEAQSQQVTQTDGSNVGEGS